MTSAKAKSAKNFSKNFQKFTKFHKKSFSFTIGWGHCDLVNPLDFG